jgi:hypothetical protein
MQPGETITPGTPPEQPQSTAPQEPNPPVSRQPAQVPDPPQEPASLQQPAPADAGWHFKPEGDEAFGDDQSAPAFHPATVSWTASEYVAHDKNAGWYLLVVLASAGVTMAVYFITREWISAGVVLILGISFAVFGARKPKTLEYAVDSTGVHIGPKQYPYSLFRTFSVVEEDAIRSILLMPMQRFNLPISVYYDPADEEKIVEALGSYLPHEDRQPAAIDRFMRKIRF